jgi:hypothetical protein
MTREVRANVLFLIGLAVLMTPGFIILMNKKLSNNPGKSNAMPDPVPYQIAYMQPLPAPPVPRREPPAVRRWVHDQIEKRLGNASAREFDRTSNSGPIVSDHFITQFLGLSFHPTGKEATLTLLRWDVRTDIAAIVPTIEADFAVGSMKFSRPAVEAVEVPKDIRHALQDVGYVDPPQKVWWISFPGTTEGEVGTLNRLRLTVPNAKPPAVETFDFQAIHSDVVAKSPSDASEAHH